MWSVSTIQSNPAMAVMLQSWGCQWGSVGGEDPANRGQRAAGPIKDQADAEGTHPSLALDARCRLIFHGPTVPQLGLGSGDG